MFSCNGNSNLTNIDATKFAKKSGSHVGSYADSSVTQVANEDGIMIAEFYIDNDSYTKFGYTKIYINNVEINNYTSFATSDSKHLLKIFNVKKGQTIKISCAVYQGSGVSPYLYYQGN